MSEKSEIQMQVETPADAPASTETPAPTYGGYATVEELVAAHEALLKAGQPAQAPSPEGEQGQPSTSTPPPKEIPEGDGGAQEVVENAGLDWDALNAEYTKDGKLSDETYESLAKAGIPRSEVDTYIAGKQAQADAYDRAVFGAAGGQEEYAALIQWAAGSLTKDEKLAFNEAVTSGNTAKAALAVEALASRRASKRGSPPSALVDGRPASASARPYASQTEMTSDMRNPKYRNDPAFRAQVLERLRVSQF